MKKSKEKLIRDYVYEKCHVSDYTDREWYWEEHISEVVRLTKKFGEKMDVDMEVLVTAAYLHDLGKILGLKNHAFTGSLEAEKLLQEWDYSEDKIQKIVLCIQEHSFDDPKPTTLESEILASCDGAAHFTTLFFERYFYDLAKGLFPNREDDWNSAVKSNLVKAMEDWEKFTIPEIKEYTKDDFECFKQRYKQFIF